MIVLSLTIHNVEVSFQGIIFGMTIMNLQSRQITDKRHNIINKTLLEGNKKGALELAVVGVIYQLVNLRIHQIGGQVVIILTNLVAGHHHHRRHLHFQAEVHLVEVAAVEVGEF